VERVAISGALAGEMSGLELAVFQLAWFRLVFLGSWRTVWHEGSMATARGEASLSFGGRRGGARSKVVRAQGGHFFFLPRPRKKWGIEDEDEDEDEIVSPPAFNHTRRGGVSG